ncbi:hypothetical protein ABE073_04710 [Lederbergia citrisecunda]|uniref:hypothetical protein n=1 Tax=Lederbergia citrisecunda TaxID=2833583 RepID=UPI003D29CD52
MFNIGSKVEVIGNLSQGIRHYAHRGSTGMIELKRKGMIIKSKHVSVHAYKVRFADSYTQTIAFEDLKAVDK